MSINAFIAVDTLNAISYPEPTNAATNMRNQFATAFSSITNQLTAEVTNKFNSVVNGSSGAFHVGMGNVATGSGNTVESNLQFTYAAVANATVGLISNDSLTETLMATDMKKQVGGVAPYDAALKIGIAGGNGNVITVDQAGFSLVNGALLSFIALTNNGTNATTINATNTGALPVYKANTANAPTILVGKAYTTWYNDTSNCFFIKASAEGNTIAAHVLAGDTFSNDDDTGLIGTFVIPHDSQAYTAPGAYNFTVPEGVTQVTVLVVGAGGGGGGSHTSAGSGGGSGGSYISNISTTPQDTLTGVVGTAGTAGAANSAGGDGGNSSISTYIGVGGKGGNGTTGGAGGVGGGDYGITGKVGVSGGAGTVGGAGGSSVDIGAGAGGRGGNGTDSSGVAGAGGKVIILW